MLPNITALNAEFAPSRVRATCVVLMFTIILIPLCWLGLAVTTVWYLYRLIRGVINFNERRAMPA